MNLMHRFRSLDVHMSLNFEALFSITTCELIASLSGDEKLRDILIDFIFSRNTVSSQIECAVTCESQNGETNREKIRVEI